jgi:tRNA modification GTPase
MSETIAAISTALLPAGLGVIRISGDSAVQTAQKIWRGRKKLTELAPNTAAVGEAVFLDTPIDECVALVFCAPHSYTGEDVVEISCHGGVYLVCRVLEAAISAGARIAQPGEFTKRAFLNGKLDLTRAEAVMDLIGAQGEAAARAALSQHEGALFKTIEKLKQQLVEISADITAWVDFPDEGVPSLEPETLKSNLEEVLSALDNLSKNFSRGRIIKEGVETAIVGRPNVGKSTLMNALAGYEKSIVTDVPGTTRDVVEDSVNFAGFVLRLWDTAGLRETKDAVESIGVARAREKLDAAQLVLAVFDGSRELNEDDNKIIENIKNRNAIAVINKCDLPLKIDREYIERKTKHVVYLSADKGEGIGALEEIIRELTDIAGFDPGAALVANGRQLECVRRAIDGARDALEAVNFGMTLDAVSVGVNDAVTAFCELTGERASDEVINRVFSKFCIGK